MLGLAILATAVVAFLGGLEQGSPGTIVAVIEAAAHVTHAVEMDYLGQLEMIAAQGEGDA